MRAAVSMRLFQSLPVSIIAEAEGVPVLMYHHLAPAGTYEGTENEDNAAIISVEQFSVQMEYLSVEGYQTIFASELISLLQRQEPLPEKTVVITFDDAYESVYVYAYPILKQYGFKADVSIIGTTVNNPAQDNYQPDRLSTMSYEQIGILQQSGLFEFHSHTHSLHQILPLSSKGGTGYAATSRIWLTEHSRRETAAEKLERLRNDFKVQDELLSSLNIESVILFYPYGETNRDLISIAKEAGMQAAFTVKTGLVTADCDIFRLPRLTVSQRDDMQSFVRKLQKGK